MDVKDLKALIKVITETDITEFEMENPDEKIVIRRGDVLEHQNLNKQAMSVAAQTLQTPAPSPAQPPPHVLETVPEVSVPENFDKIKSPIVGTFYRAPSPESPPYVEVGDVVEKGQILCLVEAMKLMNEIEAEFKGRVTAILKENAQPVEFGDILFHIEKL